MKRKLIYLVFFLVIIAGIMGPVIYANKITGQKQAASPSTGGEAVSLTAGGQTPADSAAKSGVAPAQSAGTQTDNGLSAGDAAGQDSAKPTQNPATSSPAVGVKEGGCAVGIAVVGMDGELLYGPGNVTVTGKNMWEVTALGALDATGLPYTMSTSWSGFVEAVAGQRNKGQSGWMYKVNGEIPMVAADQKTVKAGDKVIWWYSKSMGAPTPDWDDLKQGTP